MRSFKLLGFTFVENEYSLFGSNRKFKPSVPLYFYDSSDSSLGEIESVRFIGFYSKIISDEKYRFLIIDFILYDKIVKKYERCKIRDINFNKVLFTNKLSQIRKYHDDERLLG